MLARDRGRGVFRARMVVGPLAAAMILIGSVAASQAASDVFNVFKQSGAITSGTPIVTMRVPGGRYAIFAKLNIDQDDTVHHVTVTCVLTAGEDHDLNVIRLQSSGAFSVDNATMPLQLVQEFDPGSVNDIVLSCDFSELDSTLLSFRFAKVTAIRVDGESCNKPSPADCLPPVPPEDHRDGDHPSASQGPR